VVGRGGTQSKLRARRACDTWSCGPSTSPLDASRAAARISSCAKSVTSVIRYLVVAYCLAAAVILFALRFPLFALMVNARSWAVYLIGMSILAFIVTAPIAGISYVRKPHPLKLVYFSGALALLLVVGLSYFVSA
jgi:hypothetical protein